jgi:hypothetical protein
MATKLSRFDELRQQLARMQEHRAKVLQFAEPRWEESGIDWLFVAGAQSEVGALARTIKELQGEMEAEGNRMAYADQTPPDALEKYHARRKLLDQLPALNLRTVPLLVGEMEVIANWVIDDGLSIDEAFARLREQTNDRI